MKLKFMSVILIVVLFIASYMPVSEVTVTANVGNDKVEIKSINLWNTSAAIASNGDLYCWGFNGYGGVGNGATNDQHTPVKVLENVKETVLENNTTAAITEEGDLYCWGYNKYGQVGNGATDNQLTPVKVLENVKEVYLDFYTAAAITENGDLYCWGFNLAGQIGNGTTVNQLTPVKVLSNVRKFCIDGLTSAAVTENGDLYCWGDNGAGTVGIGTTTHQLTPIKVLEGVKEFYTKANTSAAITENGDLYCWGHNEYGEVGNGSTCNQLSPLKILDNVKQVCFGEFSFTTAAITLNGDLYLWGDNEHDELNDLLSPAKILENIKKFYSYEDTFGAITTNGDLYCWGKNSWGQAGSDTWDYVEKPVKILGNVKDVNIDEDISIALTENGDLYYWGAKENPNIPSEDNDDYQTIPVKVMDNVREAKVFYYTFAAITTNGDLYCWGYNTSGETGNGNFKRQYTPYKVSFPTEDNYSGELKGLSLSLSDDIGLNFIMRLSDALLIDKDNTYVEFTPEGSKKSTRVYLKDADKVNYNGTDCYSFKCRVNAAEMTKKVNAVLHCNDWTGQTYSYSVYDYASKILAEPESSEYKSSAPLIKAMLNYGGYAQTYFNEKTDVLANKELYNKANDPVLTTNTTVSKDYNYAVLNNNMGVSFLGGSLVLNSGTDLKLYYSMDDKNMANNINVSVNGQNVAPEYDGNIMCVRVPDISISSLGDTYNVKMSVNGKEINQKYSAMTYMYKALNAQNSNTKLNNVVKALYLYNEAAKQYSMGIE